MDTQDFYSYPKYYEIAFSFRGDCEAETDFFEECMRRYSKIPVRRVLEIASGPSPHLKALNRRGYEYVGVDLSQPMLAYAREKAEFVGARAQFVKADIKDFRLETPADFAFIALGSLYVDSTEALLSHFRSVAASLRPGGLYVLHWCINFGWESGLDQRYEWTEEQDGITVSVVSSVRDKLVDRIEQVCEHRLAADVDDHGMKLHLESIGEMRVVFPQEFRLIVDTQTEFEFIGWWDGEFSKPLPPTGDLDWPMTVLRRL